MRRGGSPERLHINTTWRIEPPSSDAQGRRGPPTPRTPIEQKRVQSAVTDVVGITHPKRDGEDKEAYH